MRHRWGCVIHNPRAVMVVWKTLHPGMNPLKSQLGSEGPFPLLPVHFKKDAYAGSACSAFGAFPSPDVG